MLHLANAALVLLLLANLTGLALACRRVFGSWLLARVASPVALVAVLFFVEHFFGLGRPFWIYPLSTAASAWLIVRNWRFIADRWRTEAVFFGSFAYALAWRYAFPDIDASSEKITDLTFIANYIRGDRLPPVDRWLPPSPFDMYYAMQHYGAALIGRFFNLFPGTAYNLGFSTVIALTVTAAAGTAMLLIRRRWPALLLTAAFLFGGTGISPVVRLMFPNPTFYSSIRFIGSSLSPKQHLLPLGSWLLQASHTTPKTLDLPTELFSYLVGMGDFHPPLSGFLLLALALLSIAHIEADLYVAAAWAVLLFTVPLTVPCDAWNLPLQAVLVVGYVAWRLASSKPIAWKALAIGAAAGTLLIQPFLEHFGSASVDAHMPIQLIPPGTHTPPLLGLLIFYPILMLVLLQLGFGERSRFAIAAALFWIALLVFSEFFYVDDLYSGIYERFNTVLKWWPWIYAGTLLVIGGLNLRAPSRVCRWGTMAVLGVICAFAGELAIEYFQPPKIHFGQLDGAGWLRDDSAAAPILDQLKSAPPCIVLQRPTADAYVAQPALTMFAGQTAFLGWASHENVWRNNRPDIEQRREQVQQFFTGTLADSAKWLDANHIRYVLWLHEENSLPDGTWQKLNDLIGARYFWHPLYVSGEYRVGYWRLD